MLSLIIPFYNCEKTAQDTVNKVLEYKENYTQPMEFIAVDDGSRDNTLLILKAFESEEIKVVSCGENIGKGGAVRKGALSSRGDIVIFTDADLAYGLEPIEQFAEELKTSHIAVGTRRGDKYIGRKYGVIRNLSSNLFSFAVNKLLGLDFADTQCGFKAFRGNTARSLFKDLAIKGFGFDFEILYKAKKQGLIITEIPVKLIFNNKKTTVKLFRDGVKMLWEIFRLKRV